MGEISSLKPGFGLGLPKFTVILRYEQVTIKMEVKKQNEYVYIRVRKRCSSV